MSLPLPTRAPDPLTVEDLMSSNWIGRVSSAVKRDGQALRRRGVTVEAKCLHTNRWSPILLPNNGIKFVSEDEAKRVLEMIHERSA